MSELILGTVQLGMVYGVNNGVQPSRLDALKILSKAHDLGIKSLDTASMYGDSLQVIGQFHQENPHKQFKIYSKFIVSDLKGSLADLINEQTDVLNSSKLEGIFFHRFSEYKVSPELIKSFVDKSLCKLGVSIYTAKELELVSRDQGIGMVQIPLSIFHHESSLYRQIKSTPTQLEVFVRSIFLQGLIYLPLERLTGKLEAFLPARKFLANVSSELGLSEGQLAASYAIGFDHLKGVLFGVEKEEQLKETAENLIYRRIDWDYILKNMPKVPEKLLHPGNWT